jgi:leucyl-tRNA synthetase
MKYNPNVIEAKWQNIGQKIKHLPLQTTLKNQSIMLDMFPYPGAGLHVGHPLGYIASDVYARYKDIKVLMYCTDGL